MPEEILDFAKQMEEKNVRDRVLQYLPDAEFQKVTSTIATDLLAPQVEIIAYAYYTSRAYEFAEIQLREKIAKEIEATKCNSPQGCYGVNKEHCDTVDELAKIARGEK